MRKQSAPPHYAIPNLSALLRCRVRALVVAQILPDDGDIDLCLQLVFLESIALQ